MSASRSIYQTTGFLLITEGLLLFVPMLILGPTINWPVGVDEPAKTMFPLLVEHSQSVAIGYFSYLIYSVLFWPVSLLTVQVVQGKRRSNPYLHLAIGFGITSMLARSLGIIRWLVAMPILAQIYVDPSTSQTSRATIDVVYQALNKYGGSIGEVLGVSLFTTFWLAIVAIEIIRTRTLPSWLGIFGLITSILLATQLFELFGIDTGAFIVFSVTFLQLWFLAAGIICLQRSAKLKKIAHE